MSVQFHDHESDVAMLFTDAFARAQPHGYGAVIRDAKIGPRREITLVLETWPKSKQFFGGGDVVEFRFGAVFNFEEVRHFFSVVPKNSLHFFRLAEKSNRRQTIVEMEFDSTDSRVQIVAGKVSAEVRRSGEAS